MKANREYLENHLVTMKTEIQRGVGKFQVLFATPLVTQNFLNLLEKFHIPNYLVVKGIPTHV